MRNQIIRRKVYRHYNRIGLSKLPLDNSINRYDQTMQHPS